jgi:NAD(P)-dependent dehydrogenase (short-subunit alcohol dehydrogenase family)
MSFRTTPGGLIAEDHAPWPMGPASRRRRPADVSEAVWNITPEEWEEMLRVNLTGIFLLCRPLARPAEVRS